ETGSGCCEPTFAPSASFWAGDPESVYFWGAVMGPRFPSAFAGLGYRHPAFQAAAGFGSLLTPTNEPGAAFLLTVDAKPHPRVWPGIDVRLQDSNNWSASLRLTFPLGEATPR